MVAERPADIAPVMLGCKPLFCAARMQAPDGDVPTPRLRRGRAIARLPGQLGRPRPPRVAESATFWDERQTHLFHASYSNMLSNGEEQCQCKLLLSRTPVATTSTNPAVRISPSRSRRMVRSFHDRRPGW